MKIKALIKKWWFWVGAFLIIGGIGAAVSPKQVAEEPAKESGTNVTANTTSNEYSISESAAELFCQDAGLIGKYLNLNTTNIISILNLNEMFGDFSGWFDTDGNPILYVRWNGKNKLTDEEIRFDCWISGTDENIRLHRLSAGSEILEDISPVSIVDKNGTLIFAE